MTQPDPIVTYPTLNGIAPLPSPHNEVKAPLLSHGLALFDTLDALWIYQKAHYLENCGCEFENVYKVYGTKNKNGKAKRDKNDLLFRCKEQSSCFQRYCCSSFMRSFRMDVSYNNTLLDPSSKSSAKWTSFLRLERDYTCTCCCFNRPSIRVKLVEGGVKEDIGYVTDAWSFCNYIYKLHEAKDTYTVNGSCCQCGLLCRCPCGPCSKVDFAVLNKENTKVGNISKVWPGCCRALFSDADSYSVSFPIDMSPRFKILVMVAAILIDYRHFEEGPNDNEEARIAQD